MISNQRFITFQCINDFLININGFHPTIYTCFMYQRIFNYMSMVFDQRFIVFKCTNDFSIKINDSHQWFTHFLHVNEFLMTCQRIFNDISMIFYQRFITFKQINDFSLKINNSHQWFTHLLQINDFSPSRGSTTYHTCITRNVELCTRKSIV